MKFMNWVKLWTHRPYSFGAMNVVIESTVRGFSKVCPSKIMQAGGYWRKGYVDYIFPSGELQATVEELNRDAVEKPELMYGFFKKMLEKSIELNKFSRKYSGKDLKKISNEELVAHAKEFRKGFFDVYSYATAIILLGYLTETPIYNKMNEILRRKTEKEPERFADYLLILTRPPHKLKTHKQELGILKIAKSAKEKGMENGKGIIEKFGNELKIISKEFEWLSYDFCDAAGWSLEHYAGFVEEKLEANCDKEIALLENYEEIVKREFEELARLLGLSEEEVKVFKFVGDMGYYKWSREHEFLQAYFNLKPVLNELGSRCNLSSLESMYLLHGEFESALKGPEKYKKIAQERINCLFFIANREGNLIWTGEEAETEFGKFRFEHEKIDSDLKELKGMPACAGKAKGVVKIINNIEQMTKMSRGDVLVSAATSPDLVPAMKKAVAIITNEGGIMCHAAIISRELNIPCIVGVKNANIILKDGETIEVDATKGVIRKL